MSLPISRPEVGGEKEAEAFCCTRVARSMIRNEYYVSIIDLHKL